MKHFYTFAIICFFCTNTYAQVIGFETGVPANWQGSNASSLSINTDYFREGSKSLSWSFTGGIADTLTSPINPIIGFHNGTCMQMMMFSEAKKPNNKFSVQFLLADGTVNFSYEFFQDFKGWLPIEVGYILHMRLNPPNYSGAIVKMRIISLPTNVTSKILFDKINFNVQPTTPSQSSAIRSTILPGVPYRGMVPNSSIFYYTDTLYHYFNTQPQNIFATATAQDSIEIDTIRNRIFADLKNEIPIPTNLALLKADSLFNWYNFSFLPNGDIKGKPIEYLDSLYCLMVEYGDYSTTYETALATYVGSFIHNNNNTANRDKATIMIKHFIRNGFSNASRYRIGATLQSYTADKLRASICLMYSQLSNSFKADMYDLFKYQFTLGKIWDANMVPITDSDELLLGHWMRMATCVFFITDYNEIKAHLLANKKFLNNYLTPMYGKNGISADGLGFHHDFHHNAYMYSFNKTNKSYLFPLRATKFSVDTTNFTFYRNTMLTYMYLCNNNKYNPGMVGRHPQLNYATYSRADIYYIANMEQYYYPLSERLLTKEYNRQWGNIDNSLMGNGVASYKTGFIALNYSPAAIYRFTKNGVNINASVKGLNNEFPGTEIFGNFNLFGRYQSYGNLFINYAGDKNGYVDLIYPTNKTPGWDWNKWPGTTTIHLPWDSLGLSSTTNIGYPFEFSDGKLAGSLPHPIYTDSLFKNSGSMGVYGLEFKQKKITNFHDTSFAFKKSYFFFDNKILCLGSNIKNKNTSSATFTNILQQTLEADSLAASSLNINADPKPNFPLNTTFGQAQNNWLIDRFNTGYLFMNSTDSLIIEKKNQLAPNQNNNGNFNSANMLSAVIKHGKAPTSAYYEYLVLPQTTIAEMQAIKATVINKTIPDYNIIKQDSIAHAVFATNYNAIAAVVFKGGLNIPLQKNGFPAYSRVDSQAIFIIKKTILNQFDITLVNPILNYVNTNYGVKPNPTPLVFTLPGHWIIESQKGTGTITATYNSSLNETGFLFINKQALPVEFVIKNPTVPQLILNTFSNETSCTNICNWQNSAEQNIKNYVLEKSIDGVLFDSVTTILPKRIAPISNYNYTINYPSANAYYRLKITSLTNEVSYSTVRNNLLNCKAAYAINVFPNPVKDVFKITIGTQTNEKINIVFNDIDGRLLTTSLNLNLITGVNTVNLNANKFGTAKQIIIRLFNDNGKQIALKQIIIQ